MNRQLKVAAALLSASGGPALAQAVPEMDAPVAVPDDNQLQADIDAITKKYQPQLDEGQRTIEENKDEKDPIIVKGDCWWDTTSAKMHIPKTTFKTRDFSYNVPKTTFKLRQFSFDYPRCDWKIVRIGPVKTKFLKCGKATKTWSTKVPEFKWATTRFSTKIPEFKNELTEIKFDTLKCKADDIYVGPSKPSEETVSTLQAAGAKIEKAANEQQEEINLAIERDLDRRSEAFAQQVKQTELEFDKAIAEIDASIAEIAANGMKPAQVMVDVDGRAMSLVDFRVYLANQKTSVLAQMTAEWERNLAEIRQGLTMA